ncbi:unnamed protein product [Meloidogyne enterolobii]|uniref:Uncharacterized protein n=1 Tax=Meloidogyne enterolobii TaxID=390850 RepID=A0ACB1AG52_MELEN
MGQGWGQNYYMSTNKLLIDDRLHDYRRDKYRVRGVRGIFPWPAGGGWPERSVNWSCDKMPHDKTYWDKMSTAKLPIFKNTFKIKAARQ